MRTLLSVFLFLSVSAFADFPTETVVTAQSAPLMQSQLVSDVFGCDLPISEALPMGAQTIGGRSYQTLSTGARYFKSGGNTKLMIFHAGHEQDAFGANVGAGLINYAIPLGWDVLAINMPTGDHSRFAVYENPLRAFMTPIAEALNYALMQKSYAEITMTGISGGGWSTVLYSAMDERITRSVPVAGSWPWYLRTSPQDIGDYEQTLPGLSTSYLDLYALAASDGREQLQIFYDQDPCCFAGTAPLGYLVTTKAAAQSLGGDFDIEIVANNQHNVPPSVYAFIAGEVPPFTPIFASWSLDDAAGSVLSGNYPATLYGTPLLQQAALAPGGGNSIKFNGSTQYALVPDHTHLRAGQHEYAIEFYAAFTSANIGVAFGKFSLTFPYPGPTVLTNYSAGAAAVGRIEFRDNYNAGYRVTSATTGLNDGIPRHYVFQRKNDSGVWKLQIWINGVLDAEQALASVENHVTDQPLHLFSRPSANQYVNGTFDNASYRIGSTVY